MARLHAREPSAVYRAGSPTASNSPTPSVSSDKENRSAPRRPAGPSMDEHAAKRRRVEQPNDSRHCMPPPPCEENQDLKYYDPNQDPNERRQIRKGLRELNKEAQGQRHEWMAADSTDLTETVRRAGQLFNGVKQTSDATIDSRFLVAAGDLAFKKTQQIVLGDGAQGIDVDEFISKCISFMNRGGDDSGDGGQRPNTQHRRRAQGTQALDNDEEEEDDENVGDALNWSWLGARACFPANMRPPVPGFLLGPLSVQKRVRVVRARRERLQKQNVETTRPDEVRAEDLQQAEDTGLKAMCGRVLVLFRNTLKARTEKFEADAEAWDDMTSEDVQRLLWKYGLSDDGGLSFAEFVLHPTNFGQTVENTFYVTFLIKDGLIGLQKDSDDLPTLHDSQEARDAAASTAGGGGQRHQAVLGWDFSIWRDYVELYGIKKPLVPDRGNTGTGAGATQVGSTGWYTS